MYMYIKLYIYLYGEDGKAPQRGYETSVARDAKTLPIQSNRDALA